MCNTTCAPIDLKVYLYNPKQPKWAKPKPADHPQAVGMANIQPDTFGRIFNQTTFVCIALVVWANIQPDNLRMYCSGRLGLFRTHIYTPC